MKLPEPILEQNIIQELGLNDLSDEQKTSLIEEFSSIIMEAVMLRIYTKLSPEERPDLEQILKSNNEEQLGKFIKTNVPDFDTLVTEETINFKEQMIAKRGQIKHTTK